MMFIKYFFQPQTSSEDRGEETSNYDVPHPHPHPHSLTERERQRHSHLESDAGGSCSSHPSVLEQLLCDGSRSFFPDLIDVRDPSMSVFVFTARNILLYLRTSAVWEGLETDWGSQ